jgi:hypothetical protein
MAAYSRGTSTNIIVGAAAIFVADYKLTPTGATAVPAFVSTESYKSTLSSDPDFDNVGYTMNGLELTFTPDFGEVAVDQVLDVAKLYKQGMQVTLATAFAEATLENLLLATAGKASALTGTKNTSAGRTLQLSAGDIGEVPLERGLVAVGPGTGDGDKSDSVERVYVGYRALSIESVTVSAKRDEASMFEVSFRMLPDDTTATYGKIVDRTYYDGSGTNYVGA